MAAYYNEIDKYAAEWLRNLIAAKHIAPGDVDERNVLDVHPDDIKNYKQCHFFAGVGVWSFALRRAGWPDDRPVWTGSCPCQPFSTAGQRAALADERHLWPAWFHLITQCQPAYIFGEQVASKDGLGWLDIVQTDLEGAGYANGAVDLCAAGVGAPHIRQRLWFVAERLGYAGSKSSERNTRSVRETQRKSSVERRENGNDYNRLSNASETYGLADINCERFKGRRDTEGGGERSQSQKLGPRLDRDGVFRIDQTTGPTNGLWRDVDWLSCRDGKWRPVRPGTFPLANGAAQRVGRLRAYGNAINAEVAKIFIESYLNGE